MEKFIIKSVKITDDYTAYGGDSEHTLSLNFAVNGTLYLMLTGYRNNIVPVTSHMEYIEWLLFWADSLLDMPKDQWMNADRSVKFARWNEFHNLLEKLNK